MFIETFHFLNANVFVKRFDISYSDNLSYWQCSYVIPKLISVDPFSGILSMLCFLSHTVVGVGLCSIAAMAFWRNLSSIIVVNLVLSVVFLSFLGADPFKFCFAASSMASFVFYAVSERNIQHLAFYSRFKFSYSV